MEEIMIWGRGYCLNGYPLTSVDYHKDLDVTFDCNPNFQRHTSEVAPYSLER